MRTRPVLIVAVLLNIAAATAAAWLLSWPEQAALARGLGGHQVHPFVVLPGLAWLGTGAVLAWVRPRNVIGWLLVGVGSIQVLSVLASAYGGMGVFTGNPDWPAARWAAWLASALWILGLLPLINVLPALYPDGQLPGPRWKWPVAACTTGTLLLTLGMLLDPGAYDDIAPGASPLSLRVPGWLGLSWGLLTVLLVFGGTLTIWVMTAVRLAHLRPPQRQQVAWLLVVVVLMFASFFQPAEAPLGLALWGVLIPVAVGVGIFRYNLLGIELVLRRGLVYSALTAVVIGVYLAVAAVAGSGLGRGPLPGVVAAAMVAVGLTPLRERLQREVDRFVYGERRDPMRAVARLGDQVATEDEQSLLLAVLSSVAAAVRAPGASVRATDGRPLTSTGMPGDGPAIPMSVAGQTVGTLQVSARRAGEDYSGKDLRLLEVLAQQVAVVVHALDLAEALEAEKDRVLLATRTERSRLRRDLHDGLGSSLSGASLGLVALEDALDGQDTSTAHRLVGRLRQEVSGAVGEVRRIIDDLRPATLDEAGLATSLRRQAAGARVPVDISLSALPVLNSEVETAAYRIATEALTNIGMHADATHAWLEVRTNEGQLLVVVTDDGHGFPKRADCADDASVRAGVGMASMRHRAEALGGEIHVITGDCGTTVSATFPLEST